MVPVECFFVLSAILFFIGVNRLLFPEGSEGFFFTLFSIGVSAAESAVAIAIILNVYRLFKSDSVEAIDNLKL